MLGRRALVVPLALLLGACGSDGEGADLGAPAGTVTVLAASSLTEALGEVATAVEAAHPGMEVDLSFDGSSALATAIVEGGVPADLFASADEANAEKVVAAGLAQGAPIPFAGNRLQIVVADGNPLGITGLADLAEVTLALCDPEVPCGRYAREAFALAGLPVPAAGDQGNVKGVLTQVQLGEADAGIVYVTDVLGADGVEGVEVDAGAQVRATYPLVALAAGPNPAGAEAFVAFLLAAEGQAILRDHGFGPP